VEPNPFSTDVLLASPSRYPVEKDFLHHPFRGNQHTGGIQGLSRREAADRFSNIGRYGPQAESMLATPDAETHRAFADSHSRAAATLRSMTEQEAASEKPKQDRIDALTNAADHHDLAAQGHTDAARVAEGNTGENPQTSTDAAIALSRVADGTTDTAIHAYGL